MAGVSKIADLEARKRALVAESEICRENLREQVQQLSGYGAGFFQKIDRVRSYAPWLMLVAPVAIPLFRLLLNRKGHRDRDEEPKPTRFKGKLATAMLAFRMYRKYGPLVRSIADQFLAKRRASEKARHDPLNR